MAIDTDDWVFEAIGFYQTSGGADVSGIIEYLDYRDHFRYEATEIEFALKRLTKDGRVLGHEDKYCLPEV